MLADNLSGLCARSPAKVYSVTANISGPESDLVDVCEWFTRLNLLAFSTSQCWEAPNNEVKTAVIALWRCLHCVYVQAAGH